MTKLSVEVRDHALWINHIQGDPEVAAWLKAIPGGATVELKVDGVCSVWRKMEDGTDGRPTAGLTPVTEPGRSAWHRLQSRRGQSVDFEVTDGS